MSLYGGPPGPTAPPISEEDYYRSQPSAPQPTYAAGGPSPFGGMTSPAHQAQPQYIAMPYSTGGASPRYGALVYTPPPTAYGQPQPYAASTMQPSITYAAPAAQTIAWEPDSARVECFLCNSRFTFLNRRHHCRNCGRLVCDRCSRMSLPLPHRGLRTYQRVCDACLQQLAPGYVPAADCHSHHHCH